MDTLVMIGQFLLGITILVGIHEAGHMLFAKLFGMRVEKFSIGFPPVLGWFQKGDTKYQIGLIPLGGFVKIAGMVDESMDASQLAEAPKSWEFRSKPAWQRLLVMLGGIIFNVILGCIIFSSLVYKNGNQYLPVSAMKYGINVAPLAEAIGLRNGDQITDVNGQKVERFSDLISADVLMSDNSYYTVNRSGEVLNIAVPDSILNALSGGETAFFMYDFDFEIGALSPDMPADKAGLQVGDKFIKIGGVLVPSFAPFQSELKKYAGQKVDFLVLRGTDSITINSEVTSEGRLGFSVVNLMGDNVETEHYSLIESVGVGSYRAFEMIYMNVKGLQKVFSGKVDADKAFTGFVGIGKMYQGSFDATRFWTISGMLSMALALFNLFPIPGLDGGHVVFLSYEMLTGRKASQKVQEVALKIGFSLLIFLMLYVNINDVIKNWF
jgi:regulator of sigma E protease